MCLLPFVNDRTPFIILMHRRVNGVPKLMGNYVRGVIGGKEADLVALLDLVPHTEDPMTSLAKPFRRKSHRLPRVVGLRHCILLPLHPIAIMIRLNAEMAQFG